jgi:Ca2+-transporting ATPase
VLERCTFMTDADGGRLAVDREAVQAAMAAMAERGLRVLACARRDVPATHRKLEHHHVAGELVLLGLVGMMDPPRPEAIAAVRTCQQAGIAVKMITGDHLITARVIARQIGLRNSSAAITGRELEKTFRCGVGEGGAGDGGVCTGRTRAETPARLRAPGTG